MTTNTGRVIWFTGLSGAGKSTLCRAIARDLRRWGYRVEVIDGDEMREGLCADLAFSFEDRSENIRRIAHVAALLARTGAVVLVATISPFQSLRDMVRSILDNVTEIFVDTSLAVCERRDPKGLYRKARAGEIRNFSGIDSPFERPTTADLICSTDEETVEDTSAKLFAELFPEFGHTAALPTSKRRPTIAVDFDGVIAEYSGWQGPNQLGKPRLDVVGALRELRLEGWKIIIHTTRGASDILHFLTENAIPFDEINVNSDYVTCGHKPVATVYWDDRAVTYSGNASNDLNIIRTFRTWNHRS